MGPGGNIGPWPWDGSQKNRRGFIPHPQQIYFMVMMLILTWITSGSTHSVHSAGYRITLKIPRQVAGYRGWTLSGKPFTTTGIMTVTRCLTKINARWATSILQRKHNKPFFLFTGFSRTHTHHFMHRKNTSIVFLIEKIEIPKGMLEGDLKDVHPALPIRVSMLSVVTKCFSNTKIIPTFSKSGYKYTW